MRILGIVEVHPLDGSERGLFLLLLGARGEFRVPVSPEQATILLEHATAMDLATPPPDPDGEFETSDSFEGFTQSVMGEDELDPLIIPDSSPYGMGAAVFDDDGDL